MIKFSIPIFLHFRTQQFFLNYLAKFQSITKHRKQILGPLFPWIYSHHWFSLFQFLVENWRIWRHFLKNTARIEIVIRINVENCTNTGVKVFVLLRANCCTNCYYNFNPCGIFEKMTSFTPVFNQELEQGKLMAALNSRK